MESDTRAPQTIAILGASTDRDKFGNKCLRAYRHAGWTVYPVNPKEREIEGLPAFASLADVPRPLDRISVYLRPPVTAALLPAIAEAGAEATFFNPGAADEEVLAEARRIGVRSRDACAIVDIGLSPSMFP
jgi:predicted CoA-binding protein